MADLKTKCGVISYELSLSQDEVEALWLILGVVGGSRTNSRREYASKIYNLIQEAIPDIRERLQKDADQLSGTVWFPDYVKENI